jgi:hypothetical protein
LREFNIAFLNKWCWRMLVDRGGCGSKCWQPVTGWREGVERGRRYESFWWREIVTVRIGDVFSFLFCMFCCMVFKLDLFVLSYLCYSFFSIFLINNFINVQLCLIFKFL